MGGPGRTAVHVGHPIHRQQRQAEVADAGDHAMQRRLVDDWTGQHGRAVVLALDDQAPEPVRPAVVEVPGHADPIAIVHCFPQPPLGESAIVLDTI